MIMNLSFIMRIKDYVNYRLVIGYSFFYGGIVDVIHFDRQTVNLVTVGLSDVKKKITFSALVYRFFRKVLR